MLSALRAEFDDLRLRIGRIEEFVLASEKYFKDLQSDGQRTIDHLAALQSDHDKLKEKVWSEIDGMARLRARWQDTQREISALAEAISRTGRD